MKTSRENRVVVFSIGVCCLVVSNCVCQELHEDSFRETICFVDVLCAMPNGVTLFLLHCSLRVASNRRGRDVNRAKEEMDWW